MKHLIETFVIFASALAILAAPAGHNPAFKNRGKLALGISQRNDGKKAEVVNADGNKNVTKSMRRTDSQSDRGMTHFVPNGDPRFVANRDSVKNASTTVDESAFSTGLGSGSVNAIAVSGNNVYAGGTFTTAGGVTVNYIAKWDGTNWSALGSGMNGQVNALAISGSGELYAGGSFTTAGGVSANRIAKWNGSSWSAIGGGFNGYVSALAISGDDIYAGGIFSMFGGASIAKWDGSSWVSVGTGTSGYVNAVALSGFNVYAGGNFGAAGGKPAMNIARWGIFGWFALGSGTNGEVHAILLSSGNVYVGGGFGTAGGASAPNLAIWNGSSWSSFGSGANGTVRALSLSGNGDIYAGGGFTNVAGVSANRIAKWNGSAWSPFGSGMNGQVNALAIAGNGDLYAGGSFTTAGGKPASNIAKWNGTDWSDLVRATVPSQAADISFANVRPYHMDVSWTKGNGHGRVVKMNTVNSFTAPPDGTDPSSDSNYGGSGEQVVYNNNGNAFTVTGLSPATTYYFRVYEYNNYGPYTIFNTGTATNNPNSQATTPCSLATMVVNTNDSGAGSLRQAIAGDICPGSTIGFDPNVFATPQTITLTSGQLVIDKNLTIQGPGANLLSISGSNASRVVSVNGGVTATLDGMTISDGRDYYAGGGIYNGGTLILSNSTVTGNTADFGYGGGIYNDGSLTISNSTINGNTANGYYDWWYDWYYGGSGGGIWNNGGTLIIANSTVSENTAYSEYGDSVGGGIANYGILTVINSTVTGNSSYGTICGGIVGYGDETFLNTIVALNVDGDICDEIETGSHNLIGGSNSTSGGIVNGANGNIVGVDPLLGPLQNNGGQTMTRALLAGSPAINAGDNCVLTANGCGDGNPALPTDQRGMPRVGTVDIGAFEAQGAPSPTPTPTPASTPSPTATPTPGARVNFALATNGGVASASSQYNSGYPATGTNNGDRKGLNWGSGGGWNDATAGLYPDGLEVAFDGTKTIDEIDVFTVQDNYANPVEPTESSTFTAYGITSFDVQYWDGSGWVTVQNGSISNNNKVWTKLTFSPVETAKVRVAVNASLSAYSRITEVEAWGGDDATPPPPPRTNFALASNGGVVSASSEYSSAFPVTGTNNGDRSGQDWGSGGGWNDATAGTYPDLLQIDFSGAKTIDEVDVFTVQDTYWNPSPPTADMTFNQYGITDFDIQYWSGSDWVTVPNGAIANNNKVWTKVTFPSITTSKIRVQVHNSLSAYSRIVEVEAWGGGSEPPPPPPRTNFALASNGGVASASSEYHSGFSAVGANNGDRKGLNWGAGGGWNDATAGTYPDLLQINFSGAKTIDEIDVFTVQDNYNSPVEPTFADTFTQYGITHFDVQYWNGTAWVTVPGGSVTGNNKVWTQISFPAVTTDKISVQVNNSLASYTRIVELEAWGSTPP